MAKYQIVEYTEIVENEDGSFGVIETSKLDKFIYTAEETTLKDICKELKEVGILPSIDMRKITVSDIDSDVIEFKLKKEKKPICRLVRMKYI